ncbi:MAG: AAA family ATPase [Nannocystis sp.]|uniref:AAA family ATPase n=1 Tax=Nannocystis sp. TaxID=1962667 RepID=UPI002427AF93|nr:AAA family ATPase [Nannocystis sp.]MBK9758323.1 AAA family ATPase [Nannocystis sp.]
MRVPHEVTERTDLDESGSNLATAIQTLRTRATAWSDVMAAMEKIIPGLTRIEEVVSGRYIGLRWFQRRPGNKEAEFTSTEMSAGAIRALAILVAAQQLRPHELLILEEPEVALHPGAMGVLFDSLKAASRHGSVLITTHSPELLDAARDEEILVCDYHKSATEVGPLDKGQRKLVRDGLFSISEIMRAEPLRIDGQRPHS